MDADSRVADVRVIRDVKLGNQERIAELMDRYGNQLMHYLVAILRDRGDAEDAFQDTWSKVMRKIDGFNTNKPFAPWLFRIARNRAYDHLRHKTRWRGPDQETPGGWCEPEDAGSVRFAENLERQEMLQRLLGGLKPIDREVLWLRFVDGLSYQEIGRLWRLPFETVKTRLRRALHRVAERHRELEGIS